MKKLCRAGSWLWFKSVGWVILVAGLMGSPVAVAEEVVQQVFKNVYTLVPGDGVDANSTFIIAGDGVVVVGAGASPARGKRIVEEIRKHTDKPIRYLINPNFKGGHTFGNQAFLPDTAIVSHKNVRVAMADKEGKNQKEKLTEAGVQGLDDLEITLPTVTFEESMDLYLEGFRLQLMALPSGNALMDTVVYIKEYRLLILGDLANRDIIPDMSLASIDGWLAVFKRLEKLNAEVIVPGHGTVGQKPTLIQMKHYLLQLKAEVKKHLAKGKSLKETQTAVRSVLGGTFSHWKRQDRMDANIERAYLEFGVSAR